MGVNVVAMGRAGLSGVKGKVADRVAPPVAQRTRLTTDQVEAIIGGLFLALTFLQFMRTMRRVWQARAQA